MIEVSEISCFQYLVKKSNASTTTPFEITLPDSDIAVAFNQHLCSTCGYDTSLLYEISIHTNHFLYVLDSSSSYGD